MSEAICIMLYGEAWCFTRGGKTYGYYPTPELARAAADAAADAAAAVPDSGSDRGQGA
jgi:hypothetical protein